MNKRVESLLEEFKDNPNARFARHAVATLLRMLEDGVGQLEWKIACQSLREMHYTFNVFEPYKDRRKVCIFGSARVGSDSQAYRAALEFAGKIAGMGFMVITGAGGGIMEAANRGAGRENSFGLNIELPWEQKANEIIAGDPKLIQYRYFFNRKLAFMKESDALALLPGGFGTLDEAFETLTLIQCGKSPLRPVVMIDVPDMNYWTKWLRFIQSSQLKNGFISRDNLYLWSITYDVDEACQIIGDFYRNFHSQRYVGDLLVLRLTRKLSERELAELRRDFSGIVAVGRIEQRGPLPEEADESGEIEFADLPRLAFRFDKRSFGYLRRLVDRINHFA